MTAKQKPNQTSKITQLYLDYCKECGLQPKLKRDGNSSYTISYTGNNAEITNQITFHKELGIISVFNYTFIKFSQSNLLNLFQLVNEINHILNFHSLIIEVNEDVVALRNEAQFSTLLLEADLLKETLESGLVLLDQFIPAINLVNYGVMGVEEAMDTAERLEHTQDMVEDMPN